MAKRFRLLRTSAPLWQRFIHIRHRASIKIKISRGRRTPSSSFCLSSVPPPSSLSPSSTPPHSSQYGRGCFRVQIQTQRGIGSFLARNNARGGLSFMLLNVVLAVAIVSLVVFATSAQPSTVTSSTASSPATILPEWNTILPEWKCDITSLRERAHLTVCFTSLVSRTKHKQTKR